MNWLAHLYLSEPSAAFRLGNLLPDIISARDLAVLPSEFQRGIRRHRQIDAYTDAHPVFRQSILRLGPAYRRFGGVLIDIFYDHVLAREWNAFADIPLSQFAAEVYAGFEPHWMDIPAEARHRLQAMSNADWLSSYRQLDAISTALTRIGGRLRRPTDLAAAVVILERDYDAFRNDFREFFPQLITHITSHAEQRPPPGRRYD